MPPDAGNESSLDMIINHLDERKDLAYYGFDNGSGSVSTCCRNWRVSLIICVAPIKSVSTKKDLNFLLESLVGITGQEPELIRQSEIHNGLLRIASVLYKEDVCSIVSSNEISTDDLYLSRMIDSGEIPMQTERLITRSISLEVYPMTLLAELSVDKGYRGTRWRISTKKLRHLLGDNEIKKAKALESLQTA